MNLFLLHPQRFYTDVVRELVKRGHQLAYVCGDPALLPDIPADVHHSLWYAFRGQLPPTPALFGISVSPRPDLVATLQPWETLILQMLERNNAPGWGIHDLRRAYLRYVDMWAALLEAPFARQPVVVFHMFPHMAVDYVLYLLCRRHFGVQTLIIDRTYLPDRMMIAEGLDNMPGGSLESQDWRTPFPNYYNAYNAGFEDRRNLRSGWTYVRDTFAKTLTLYGELLVHPLRWRQPVCLSTHALLEQPITWAHFRRLDALRAVELYGMRRLYECRTRRSVLAFRYVFFPLQYQPEKTSLPMGEMFADQLLAIRTLVAALPEGWKVVVKEHPRTFTQNPIRCRLARSRVFYCELFRLQAAGRVELVSCTESSAGLIKYSAAVATVGGTAGWEAVQDGKPALVFGNCWYMNCPGVYRVRTVPDCRRVLLRRDVKPNPASVEAFCAHVRHRASFPGYMTDEFGRVSLLTYEENVQGYANAIAARIS